MHDIRTEVKEIKKIILKDVNEIIKKLKIYDDPILLFSYYFNYNENDKIKEQNIFMDIKKYEYKIKKLDILYMVKNKDNKLIKLTDEILIKLLNGIISKEIKVFSTKYNYFEILNKVNNELKYHMRKIENEFNLINKSKISDIVNFYTYVLSEHITDLSLGIINFYKKIKIKTEYL